jgi:hypothetical protein
VIFGRKQNKTDIGFEYIVAPCCILCIEPSGRSRCGIIAKLDRLDIDDYAIIYTSVAVSRDSDARLPRL